MRGNRSEVEELNAEDTEEKERSNPRGWSELHLYKVGGPVWNVVRDGGRAQQGRLGEVEAGDALAYGGEEVGSDGA